MRKTRQCVASGETRAPRPHFGRHRSICRRSGAKPERIAGAPPKGRRSPMRAVETKTPIELAFLLALATLWGASYTLIKIGVETIPPVTFNAARTLFAGA